MYNLYFKLCRSHFLTNSFFELAFINDNILKKSFIEDKKSQMHFTIIRTPVKEVANVG